MNYSETYFELDSEEATHCYHCHLICIKGHVETVDTKDQSNAIVYGMFVDTVDMKIKACKCIECYVCRDCQYCTGVCGSYTIPIQSTMRCENSTLLCIKWPLTLILNQFSIRKKFWKAETKGFSTMPSILSILYMSILSIQDKDL